MSAVTDWLLESGEPWTRYRTLVDLLGRPQDDPQVQAARATMVAHPAVLALTAGAATWGDRPFQRHNDAGYPIYQLTALLDFGLRPGDPGLDGVLQGLLARQSAEGAFQSLLNIPKAFGGSGEDAWTWVLCDAPVVLHALLAAGLAGDERVQRAVQHLVGTVHDNGWRCVCAPELGKFRGPGRREDPCPIVNLFALRALAHLPELAGSPAVRAGVDMLLGHWENRGKQKYYLFGIGTDFCKLKYPFVWYDVLHVLDVLSHFPAVHGDPRFRDMLATVTGQADATGCYTATSMYRAWKGWSFADKKRPSPWLTFAVLRILSRLD
ncbi:MAG: hypothetical protein EHM56_01095 [Chloroflexi bacterium]|nr:MAG: hypothetical protein EHM56_01095 [Chloroflexota bacterium]